MATEVTTKRDEQPQVDPNTPAVEFDEVSLAFDDKVILDRVSFALPPAKMRIILGASGAGKSTILRLILGLLKPDSGRIRVFGEEVQDKTEADLMGIRANIGMVFQEGALFDSFTVRENVGYRLFEETKMPIRDVDARVKEVLGYVGLGEYAERMPSELSGGQRRRVAIARALTSKPKIILYDEPTTGLDPITALTIDHEIVKLRDLEHVSSIIVTHQLRDAFFVATHAASGQGDNVQFTDVSHEHRDDTVFLMLKEGRIAFEGRADELRASDDEYLRSFLS
jgi:phospholipid/cholesterol/gamma-HCH transport system ATP-binding protein